MRTAKFYWILLCGCYDGLDGERVYGERDCLTTAMARKTLNALVFLFNCTSGLVVPDRCLQERCDGAALRGSQGGEPSPTTSRPPTAPC